MSIDEMKTFWITIFIAHAEHAKPTSFPKYTSNEV